jgi:hypothetical protein
MEDSNLLVQTLFFIIVFPFLVLFYWYIVLRVLAFIIRVVKKIWNSTD